MYISIQLQISIYLSGHLNLLLKHLVFHFILILMTLCSCHILLTEAMCVCTHILHKYLRVFLNLVKHSKVVEGLRSIIYKRKEKKKKRKVVELSYAVYTCGCRKHLLYTQCSYKAYFVNKVP